MIKGKILREINNLDKSFEIFNLISKKRKFQFLLISIIALFAAVFESFSIGLLVPIVSLLTNQYNNYQNENKFLSLIESINFTNIDSSRLLFYLFIFVILIGSFIKILYSFLQAKYGAIVVQEFNNSILRNSVLKPYDKYIENDSSIFISAILNKTSFLSRYLGNLLSFLVTIFSGITIITVLVVINLKLTIFIFIFVFVFYWIISTLIKNRVKLIGKISSELYTVEYDLLNEIHGFKKEILLNNFFRLFLRRFIKVDSKYRETVAEASYLTASPRYILEAMVLIFASIAILISIESRNFDIGFLPFLAAFLLGIQKLLPIVQTFYASWINHKSCENAVLEVIRLTKEFKEYSIKYLNSHENMEMFSCFKTIELKNINFSYSSNNREVIKKLNLKIKKGEFIGIVGASGEGKSTLLNILCGLNKPNKGSLLVDNYDIFSNFTNLKSWRNSISYVSQNIYLSPKSIIDNITLGENENQINYERLNYAIKISKLEKFIKNLKHGLKTNVGEQGVQISGGQKQRLALARAVYKKCNLLILDEATSALDKKNEMGIISSIGNINYKDLTIIAVSHKIEILKAGS